MNEQTQQDENGAAGGASVLTGGLGAPGGIMKEKIKRYAGAICLGMLIMVGFRIVEYVIPRPETRIIVCMVGEDDNAEICKSLAELRDKHGT